MNNLINYARGGGLNTAKIRVMAIKDGQAIIVKETPSSENLTICICANSEQQQLFPADGVVLFVPDLEDAMELINI